MMTPWERSPAGDRRYHSPRPAIQPLPFYRAFEPPLIKEHRPRVVLGGNGAWEVMGEKVESTTSTWERARAIFPRSAGRS